jgi:hypothetical protein
MRDFPQNRDRSTESPPGPANSSRARPANAEKTVAFAHDGRLLLQDSFFFCTIPGVGDLPGAGSIYLETVVDRDSGVAFAKIYSTRKSINGVDILTSRVIPFFERQGETIKEIQTRHTSEYCGPVPKHPFHTFLTSSSIQHVVIDAADYQYAHVCQGFFCLLVKEFLEPALRRSFRVSIDALQKDLDVFIEAYNSRKSVRSRQLMGAASPANFPVDL